MSERFFFSLFVKDKTITNPINKSEIFLCSDLYRDHKTCKMLYNKGIRKVDDCKEIRKLGQKCYMMDQEDFERYLVKMFEEKVKYIKYLKQEGSILYDVYKEDPTVFSVKKTDENDSGSLRAEMNEYFANR
jgi:hypothetical protein